MRRFRFGMIGLVLVLVLAVGCSPTAAPAITSAAVTAAPTSAPKVTEAPTSTSEATEVPTAAPTALTGKFTAAGSTSLQPLAETLSEAFMAANSGVEITIQGGGSGVGVKSVQDGTAELGMVSRELTEEEKPGLTVYTVAQDAIVLVVNKDVPVEDLTRAQVKDIFSGVITNWNQVGGPDQPIVVVSREEGSGTRGAFQELVLGKEAQIVATAILQSSNGAVLNTVASTPYSIAYLSLGYVDDSIKVLKIEGVQASEETVKSGQYPIFRPLSFISKGEATGVVKVFLDWALGPDGQKIVAEEGYVPVK